MKRLLFVTLFGICLTEGVAFAQYGAYPTPNYGPGYRGNISPYLNVLRGFNVGIDYYLGTRSEFQRRLNAQEFRTDISALLQQNRDFSPPDDLPEMGRPIPSGTYPVVNNTGGYFNNTGPYFAYPSRQGTQPLRAGMYTPPPRRGGSARKGPSSGSPSK